MKTCRDLTRLARFMTRWLKERGRDGWTVVAQIERDRFAGWRREPAADRFRRGYLWAKDGSTATKRRRLLAQGSLEKGDENARESLLSRCWEILGAESVEEVALRWAVLGDDAVLDWFDGNRPRPGGDWRGVRI